MRFNPVLVVAALAMFLVADSAFAQEAAHAASMGGEWVPIGAGIGLGLAALGGGLGQAKIISSALESIARNPGASGQMFLVWFLGIVFVESLVVYSLVTSLKLLAVW